MIEINDNIWNYYNKGYFIGVNTNGDVNREGRCVMGRGLALQVAKRIPKIPFKLGELITKYGNNVYILQDRIISIPVKHHWHEKADINLIIKSMKQLIDLMVTHNINSIFLTRPGCGNGGLKWEDVKPVIEPLLDSKFTIVNI